MSKVKECKEYLEGAENAANLERTGKYQEACTEWSVLRFKAKRKVNQAWADARALFCWHEAETPFTPVD